jgi:hypothetical protein
MCIKESSSRAEAIRNADVVITFGPVKKSFGKPTLKLVGELLVTVHSDQIRRFLRETGATSVAFALTSNQPYWKVFKVVRHAFDWSRKNFSAMTHEQKQEIRDLYAEGVNQTQLSIMFGISQPAITFIVTGHSDRNHFSQLRSQGYVTLNTLAMKENVAWPDAEKKAEDLKIKIHKIGPMLMMVDRKDAKRLRSALKRVYINRSKRLANLTFGCRKGHPWTEENTYRWGGRKVCRTCRLAAERRRYHRKRAG